MFRYVLVALALSVVVGSVSSAEVSAARHDAEVAQMQFAQFLRARNAEVDSKRVALAPKATIARLHALRDQRFAADAVDGRKLAAVTQLAAAVTQIERAKSTGAALPKDFRIIESHPTRWRAQPMGDDLAACRNALEHDLSTPLRLTLAKEGAVWLRISAPAAGTWAFDTFVTEFDTRLSLYRDCREIGHAPLDTSDDALGLGSIVGFTAKTAGETRVVKLERIGGLGDLVVAKGGEAMSFAGRVTREAGNSPIANLAVNAVSTSFSGAQLDYTNSQGDYQIYVYEAGDYWLRTGVESSPDYHVAPDLVDEAYPDAPCLDRIVWYPANCHSSRTSISVAEGVHVTELNLALGRGAVAVGRLIDQSTGSPLASADVDMFTPATQGGVVHRVAATDVNGRFRIEGLSPADWHVEFGHPQHVRERWNNVPCGSSLASVACAEGAGSTVSTDGVEVVVLDADLEPLAVFPMRVTSNGQLVNATVVVYTANGNQFTTASSQPNGTVFIGPLPAGQYRFVVNAVNQTASSRVYGGPSCYLDCVNRLFDGQVVTVPIAQALPLQVDLEPFPKVTGVVSDAATGEPLAGARVILYREGYAAANVLANASGQFESASLLPSSYLVHARAAGYVDEMYSNVPCESDSPISDCDSAQPLELSPGQAGPHLEIALSPAGMAMGRVRSVGNGAGSPVVPEQTILYRLAESGEVEAADYLDLDALGNFVVQEIPTGTYIFGASAHAHRSQLFPGLHCSDAWFDNNPACPIAAASRVTWTGSELNRGIDFELSADYSRLVRVRDAETLVPLPNVIVDQWSTAGLWLSSSTTNSQGVAQVRNGYVNASGYSAIVTTDNGLGYLDQVYEGQECALGASAYRANCSIESATLVPVHGPDNLPYPRIEILLRSADPLFKSDFE